MRRTALDETHGQAPGSKDTAIALSDAGFWRLQEELRRTLGGVAQTPEAGIRYGLRPRVENLS